MQSEIAKGVEQTMFPKARQGFRSTEGDTKNPPEHLPSPSGWWKIHHPTQIFSGL